MYYLCYKGKLLGEMMTLEKAEAMLLQFSFCFKNLEIVRAEIVEQRIVV